MEKEVPPGQRYVKKFIYYAALGVPKVDINSYKLIILGEVEKRIELTYEQLLNIINAKYIKDFHCVTGWSVANVEWEGVKIKTLAEMAKVKNTAKWVMFYSLDGYTSIVPIEDALTDDAIIALKMNGKPLDIKSGFPARPFIPHLYAWKSAKWLTAIEFRKDYADGFWEERGYHERGNIWEEERFKGENYSHEGMKRNPIL
jgi:DMSO/TMAO reductase YedYZ molybdopterin-dependent catalytic subunit